MKTVKEWSDAFDVLFNEVMSNASAALDEYDKSIFLTKGQEEVIKNYFNPKGNKYQEGFDDSAKRQADFATLLKNATLSEASSYDKFDARSTAYQFPNDYFLAINEQFQVTSGTKVYPYTIIPISYDTYNKVMRKPYKYPAKASVWRIITGTKDTGDGVVVGYWHKVGQSNVVAPYTDAAAAALPNSGTTYTNIAAAEADGWSYTSVTIGGGKVPVAEIIGIFNPSGTGVYKLRYVRRPKPIILVDLTTVDNSLSINGLTSATPCELPEHIHEEILQRAVELAKAAYATDQNGTVQLNNQVQVGQRSE